MSQSNPFRPLVEAKVLIDEAQRMLEGKQWTSTRSVLETVSDTISAVLDANHSSWDEHYTHLGKHEKFPLLGGMHSRVLRGQARLRRSRRAKEGPPEANRNLWSP